MYDVMHITFFANKKICIVIVCIGFFEDKILSMNDFSMKLSNTLTLIIEF
jgi:hypothetical protein